MNSAAAAAARPLHLLLEARRRSVDHLLDDMLSILRSRAQVGLCAPATVLPLCQVLRQNNALLIHKYLDCEYKVFENCKELQIHHLCMYNLSESQHRWRSVTFFSP